MTSVIGSVTVASALLAVALGQVTAGAEFLGVILAAGVLMTLRA
jgi:hypothetical protein